MITNYNNIKSPVCCTSPSIIFHPNFYDNFIRYGEVHFYNKVYKYSDYSDYSIDDFRRLIYLNCKVDLSNYSKVIIPRKGRPAFQVLMAVPCGKCDLCRTNKANEYSFRATCETATYPDMPLFITLTFQDKYCPADGVRVEDLQKFFKKLRFHLHEQKEMKDQPYANLRYLACGEYGSKHGRPHYHIILWNYPINVFRDDLGNVVYTRLYNAIYKSWLEYVKDDEGKRIYFEYYYKDEKGRKRMKLFPRMESKGMIKILPVDKGCPGYITKYIRKSCHNVAGYPNKTFLLSSRKNGGIGSSYIRQYRDYCLANKDCFNLKISVKNQFTNRVEERGITGYLKNLLFPSKSQQYSKKRTHEILSKVSCRMSELMACGVVFSDHKWRFPIKATNLTKQICRDLSDYIFRRPYQYYRNAYSYLFRASPTTVARRIKELVGEINMLYSLLNLDYVRECRKKLLDRRRFMSAREQVRQPVTYNIVAANSKYEYNYTRYLQRCTF